MKAITSTSDQARVWDQNWNLLGTGAWDTTSATADITADTTLVERVKGAVISGQNIYVSVEAEGGRIAGPVRTMDVKRGRDGIRTTLTL